MKRFFAILICSIIIFCHFVPVVPGHSAEVVIEQGIDFFYKSWDMIYSLINGGVIQTSPYQGIADQATAVAAYYEDWGENLLKALNYIVPSDDAIVNSQSAITFPLKLGMTRDYYNTFISEYLNYATDNSNGFKAALTGDALAAWNRYNYNWINKYLNAFTPSDTVIVSPDADYLTSINLINNSGNYAFFWKNSMSYPNTSSYANGLIYGAPTSYSYVAPDSNQVPIVNGQTTTKQMALCDVTDINIISNNGVYSLNTLFTAKTWGELDPSKWGSSIYPTFATVSGSTITPAGRTSNLTWHENYTLSYSGNLQACFDYIQSRCRNVNIYVDGVCWAYVGDNAEPIFLAPDVITNSDGIVLGHDVYFPEQDLYIDLISWKQLLEDKIADGEAIDFDDLIDGGVIVDGNDIPVTDEDQETLFEKKDSSLVIDIGLDDADTSDLLPDAPTPPDDDPTDWNFPEFPIPDLTDGEDPKSTGLSVLARIINVTNQSLPPELISMFWGICITLVILGIIKILHK